MKIMANITHAVNGYSIHKGEVYEDFDILHSPDGSKAVLIHGVTNSVIWSLNLFTEVEGMAVVANPSTFSLS